MKRKYFLICNKSLLLFMPLAVLSGILLECLHGEPLWHMSNTTVTWLHVVSSAIMSILILWHMQLHWGNAGKWYRRCMEHHSKGFRFTTLLFLLTVFTGLLSLPYWLANGHNGIGGVHGKVGLLCAFFMAIHVLKHWKWYTQSKHC